VHIAPGGNLHRVETVVVILYIEKLVQAGILREVASNTRNKIYRADEIFGALDNLREQISFS
jgi:hypothetical protein